jgi:hypothetical protein
MIMALETTSLDNTPLAWTLLVAPHCKSLILLVTESSLLVASLCSLEMNWCTKVVTLDLESSFGLEVAVSPLAGSFNQFFPAEERQHKSERSNVDSLQVHRQFIFTIKRANETQIIAAWGTKQWIASLCIEVAVFCHMSTSGYILPARRLSVLIRTKPDRSLCHRLPA